MRQWLLDILLALRVALFTSVLLLNASVHALLLVNYFFLVYVARRDIVLRRDDVQVGLFMLLAHMDRCDGEPYLR